jgi:type VI secretion system protein ImpI
MSLRLTLENEQTLPDGGPVSFQVTGKRSIDIGRDRHLDWTLPDPTRIVSGKHCEVHYRDGGYWLHDVSTNGTFLNDADQRMRGPHRLRNGDRVIIGHYIVGVAVDASDEIEPVAPAAGVAPPFMQQHADYREIWTSDREAPPPIDPQQLRTPREAPRPVNAEFLDWAASVPEPDLDRNRAPFRPREDRLESSDMSWARGSAPAPEAPPPPPAAPAPRRPARTAEASPWPDEGSVERQESVSLAPPPQERQMPLAAPQPAAPVSPAAEGDAAAFLRQLAVAAGLPDNTFANRDSAALASELGATLRTTVEGLMSLLQARMQAKQLTRSASQTMIQAIENNPLKFSPTPDDAMRIMFGPPTRSYLDARSALTQGFGDLKSHQLKTYVAMQHAVAQMMASVDPLAMAREMDAQGTSKSWVGSNKSKLWDAFVMRWTTQFGRDPGAPMELFMRHFADFYDRGGKTETE